MFWSCGTLFSCSSISKSLVNTKYVVGDYNTSSRLATLTFVDN